MEFKDIKQWSVSNLVATPVNPHIKETMGPFNVVGVDKVGQYSEFENTKAAHTFATNAADGVLDAERFGEPDHQLKHIDESGWITHNELRDQGHDYNYFEYYYKMLSDDYLTRQFLPFHPQPVEEKESEKITNEYAIKVKIIIDDLKSTQQKVKSSPMAYSAFQYSIELLNKLLRS